MPELWLRPGSCRREPRVRTAKPVTGLSSALQSCGAAELPLSAGDAGSAVSWYWFCLRVLNDKEADQTRQGRSRAAAPRRASAAADTPRRRSRRPLRFEVRSPGRRGAAPLARGG